jgi:hypothetical protein
MNPGFRCASSRLRDCKTDQGTVKVELAVTVPAVAEMTDEPEATAVAKPELPTVATLVLEDDQMLYAETSSVVLEQVALAV